MSRCLNLAQTAAPLEKTTFVSSAPVMFTTGATWIIRCVFRSKTPNLLLFPDSTLMCCNQRDTNDPDKLWRREKDWKTWTWTVQLNTQQDKNIFIL